VIVQYVFKTFPMMRILRNAWLLGAAIFANSLQAQQGLLGEYYNGTNFETKVVSRVDRAVDFDWPLNVSPAVA